jgi:hypothetical protein
MFYVLVFIIVLLLLIGPQFWASHVLKKHSKRREDLQGSGGELAQHLIERFQLNEVKLEITPKGDHYDPLSRTVRLEKAHFDDKSITAIAVATHEVGHAIQHHSGYKPLLLRTRLAMQAAQLEKVGSAALIMAPVASAIVKSPHVGLFMLIAALFCMAAGSLVHLITLPVEWDASFAKALPILNEGNYINDSDIKAVRSVLMACALTYVAGSLASLLNIWRWISILRR